MKKKKYRLPDLSRGDPSAKNPLPRDLIRYAYEELDDRFVEHYLELSRERIRVSPEGSTRVAEMVEQAPEPTREPKALMREAREEESPAG